MGLPVPPLTAGPRRGLTAATAVEGWTPLAGCYTAAMKRRAVLWLLIGWLLGVASGLMGLAVTGGWYEYRVVQNQARYVRAGGAGEDLIWVSMINAERWEFVSETDPLHNLDIDLRYVVLRRPRVRLPF